MDTEVKTAEPVKATHNCPTFKLTEFLEHGNADKLKVVAIPNTHYEYCANYDDWKDHLGKLVCWVHPDSLVNTTKPEFQFLITEAKYNADSSKGGTFARVKAKRIRGRLSYGILCLAPEGLKEGDNAAEALGVAHYEPSVNKQPDKNSGIITGGEVAKAPELGFHFPKYDIDSLLGYKNVFQEGEPVWVTLKYHGTNGSWVYTEDNFHCKSHYEWKREFPSKPTINEAYILEKFGEELGRTKIEFIKAKLDNWQPKRSVWWEALRQDEVLQEFLKSHPNVVVCGEVVNVQGDKFRYGCKPGEYKIRVFDLMKEGRWLDPQEAKDLAPQLNWVTCFHTAMPFNLEKLVEITESLPTDEGPIPEGIVVAPLKNRYERWCGRVKFKLVSTKYLNS